MIRARKSCLHRFVIDVQRLKLASMPETHLSNIVVASLSCGPFLVTLIFSC